MNRPRRHALAGIFLSSAILASLGWLPASANPPEPRDLEKEGAEIGARAKRLSARVDGDSLELFAPVFPDSGGNRYLTIATDRGPAVLVFSTPYRAYRYMRFQPDSLPPYGILLLRAPRCAENLRTMGAPLYVLDRSPSCASFAAHPTDSVTADDLKLLWAVGRLTSQAVYARHVPVAFEHALAARYRDALSIVADLLACVNPDDVSSHCLLGACGIGLENDALVAEAVDGLDHIAPQMADWLREVAAEVEQRGVKRRQSVERILAVIQEGQRQAAESPAR